MTLGSKLRELRTASKLSQPQLAEKLAIEQSYLSKLENDKSVPSSEVFIKILSVFALSVEAFLFGFDHSDDLKRLQQIPEVKHFMLGQTQKSLSTQRSYLYVCSLLVVVAVTLFYVGYSKQIFDERHYLYESDGVIREGEPKDVFRTWHSLLSFEEGRTQEIVVAKRQEMQQRKDSKTIESPIDNGRAFQLDVKEGYRYYEFEKEKQVPRPINAWLQVLAVMLFASGIMGFVLEQKLTKVNKA